MTPRWERNPDTPDEFPTERLAGEACDVNVTVLPDGSSVVSLSLLVPAGADPKPIGERLFATHRLDAKLAATPSASPDREALREAAQRFIDAKDHSAKATIGNGTDVDLARALHASLTAEAKALDALRAALAAPVPDAPGAGLDVERLARAMERCGVQLGQRSRYAAIAREYAAATDERS